MTSPVLSPQMRTLLADTLALAHCGGEGDDVHHDHLTAEEIRSAITAYHYVDGHVEIARIAAEALRIMYGPHPNPKPELTFGLKETDTAMRYAGQMVTTQFNRQPATARAIAQALFTHPEDDRRDACTALMFVCADMVMSAAHTQRVPPLQALAALMG